MAAPSELDEMSEAGLGAPGEVHPYTDFQWYLSGGRNAVYFGAFTRDRLTRERWRDMVADVMALAPQLHLRSDHRRQAHVDARPFDLDDIVSFAEVESFDGFPDRVVAPNEDLFDDPRLPAFRAECYALRDGETGDGNRSFILYRSSHALMEGADTAAVVRGRQSDHAAGARSVVKPWARLAALALGIVYVPLNYAVTALFGQRPGTSSMATLTFDRRELKRKAAELGVGQRSLIFALVMYGFYHRAGGRSHTISYTNLSSRRAEGDDAFLKLRMHALKIPDRPDFADYVREFERRLAADNRDVSWLQIQYGAFFAIHRRIARVLPFLYGRRFFGFVPQEFLLSLIPPHAAGGLFAPFGINDIYCGSYTAGINCCVIVPQQDRVSLSIYCPTEVLGRISDIAGLSREIGISAEIPARAARAAIKARSAAEA